MPATATETVTVGVENFTRAESDLFFGNVVRTENALGKLVHHREPASVDQQNVIRLNRDTLYSVTVLDLDAGPATFTLPDSGSRFRSFQVIDEDQYTHAVNYAAGKYTLTRADIGTRYVMVGMRTFVDPNDPKDLAAVHALQDATTLEQASPGKFEVPNWDPESQKKVREALLFLSTTLPDTKRTFGKKGEVDPVRFLLGSAFAWGGNPEKDALYLNVVPPLNDGKTVHRITVKDVPVDGFWSISVYNAKGYYEKNDRNAYSINNVTGKKDADGTTTIQFGGEGTGNVIPITPGWNYIARLYRPRPEILDGTWKFPEAKPV
jgi:hypothetical protein